MNGLVYHVVSGQAFFSGMALLLASFALAQASRKAWKRWWGLAFVMGLILIAASSIAIPLWLLVIAGMATLVWLYLLMRADSSRQSVAAMMAAIFWLAVAIGELPYLLIPALQPVANRGLAVIGDSVTAGMGGEDRFETWPAIIARKHQLQVQDLSHVGETAGSALKRIRNLEIQAPVVMVEIGGNDILGSTSSQQFATDLDALLNRLSAPGRQIVMFELPLPPLYHEFGRVQRTLAQKYRVHLIPRRIFLSLLADQGATLDSIHLSQAGHQQMAESVWQLVQTAYVNATSESPAEKPAMNHTEKLPDEDSNLNQVIQSHSCYHYTIRQWRSSPNAESSRCLKSSLNWQETSVELEDHHSVGREYSHGWRTAKVKLGDFLVQAGPNLGDRISSARSSTTLLMEPRSS